MATLSGIQKINLKWFKTLAKKTSRKCTIDASVYSRPQIANASI